MQTETTGNLTHRTTSRTGAFGRAVNAVEPGKISQSDLAYLKFFFRALHGSIHEVRASLDNRALANDVLDGIDLLIENAGRRFGMPLFSQKLTKVTKVTKSGPNLRSLRWLL